MHDIKWIREHPDAFDNALARRGMEPHAQHILSLDEQMRSDKTKLQELQSERNQKSKAIGAAMGQGKPEEAEKLKEEVSALKQEMTDLENALEQDTVSLILQNLPNILAEDVPDGADEAANIELRVVGEPAKFNFKAKDHVALGEGVGLMDFETAANVSGARFVFLSGALAQLERALAQFMLDLHATEHGFTETNPPLLVKEESMFGTGQLPKFGEDSYKTTEGHWLIPTAEVSLTNMMANQIVPEHVLPRRYTAYTPCFRSEAGSAGKDTRGMIRQHQFTKVEMVCITHPDESAQEHERMLNCAEEVLKRLKLPYRVVTLCSGDTGFGATKTYDLEVWLPGQDAYREISSVSNCQGFQARRMNARFRPEGQEKGTEFVHTLNGSGVAVGRCLVAVVENYQREDGSIEIPEVLRPYMRGVEVIPCVS